MNSYRTIFRKIVIKVSDLSVMLETKIYKIKEPKWKYPKIELDYNDTDISQLLSTAEESDVVFLDKPRVSRVRNLLYFSLRIPFRILRKITRMTYGQIIRINRAIKEGGR